MWPRLRGSWALASQATCFDPTIPRTDLEGTSTHVTVGFVSCLSTLMHIQSSTQKIFIEPLLRARHCFTCWGKNSYLDKAPALMRLTF